MARSLPSSVFTPAFLLIAIMLASCASDGGGDSNDTGNPPPGSPSNLTSFFPLSQGNLWRFQGTVASTTSNPVTYFNTASVAGVKTIGSTATLIWSETNPDNSGPNEDYLVKNSQGIQILGTNDPGDPITPQLVPFTVVPLPMTVGRAVDQFGRSGVTVDWGEDLDGDGRNETANIKSRVTLTGFEDVTVPIGVFSGTARLETEVTVVLVASSNRSRVTVTVKLTEWYAANVGPLKRVSEVFDAAGNPAGDTTTEGLIGYRVDGQARGVMPEFVAVSQAGQPNSNTATGRAALAFSGSSYLVAYCHERDQSLTYDLSGLLLSKAGIVLNAFDIASSACQPSAAFDGTNFLVTFGRSGSSTGSGGTFGVLISQDGTVLSPPGEFRISDDYGAPVAFDGTNYLAVRNGGYGTFITRQGTVISDFPIFTALAGRAEMSVGFNGTNYLVAWRETTGSEITSDIYAARVSPAGVVLDPDGLPISTAPGLQGGPVVASDGDGYLVSWLDGRSLPDQFQPTFEIYGRLVTADGALMDGPSDSGGIPITASLIPALYPVYHTSAFDGSNYVLSWTIGGFLNNPPHGLFINRVTRAGQTLGPPLLVSQPPCVACRFVHPTLSFNGESSLLVWVNNSEQFGVAKEILGLFLFPFD